MKEEDGISFRSGEYSEDRADEERWKNGSFRKGSYEQELKAATRILDQYGLPIVDKKQGSIFYRYNKKDVARHMGVDEDSTHGENILEITNKIFYGEENIVETMKNYWFLKKLLNRIVLDYKVNATRMKFYEVKEGERAKVIWETVRNVSKNKVHQMFCDNVEKIAKVMGVDVSPYLKGDDILYMDQLPEELREDIFQKGVFLLGTAQKRNAEIPQDCIDKYVQDCAVLISLPILEKKLSGSQIHVDETGKIYFDRLKLAEGNTSKRNLERIIKFALRPLYITLVEQDRGVFANRRLDEVSWYKISQSHKLNTEFIKKVLKGVEKLDLTEINKKRNHFNYDIPIKKELTKPQFMDIAAHLGLLAGNPELVEPLRKLV